jgi:alkylhydroperoxidase family enzyme
MSSATSVFSFFRVGRRSVALGSQSPDMALGKARIGVQSSCPLERPAGHKPRSEINYDPVSRPLSHVRVASENRALSDCAGHRRAAEKREKSYEDDH